MDYGGIHGIASFFLLIYAISIPQNSSLKTEAIILLNSYLSFHIARSWMTMDLRLDDAHFCDVDPVTRALTKHGKCAQGSRVKKEVVGSLMFTKGP